MRAGGTAPRPRANLQRMFLRGLDQTLNRLTRRLARTGHGPFSLVIHAGRRSGREYRTPLILARVPEGFITELTYGDKTDWLRNIEAAGGCTVVYRAQPYRVTAVEPCPTARGLAAFPRPARLVLRTLHKKHFRLLRVAGAADGRAESQE